MPGTAEVSRQLNREGFVESIYETLGTSFLIMFPQIVLFLPHLMY